MKLATFAIAATLALVPAAIFAQATATTPATPPTINERKVDQQDRIGQGVKSGELTAGETSHLEHQEAGINKEESGMRAQDNGHLTTQDRKTLTAQQNKESKRIYRDKHNTHIRKS
jgi:Spy/CpxP family protein refolding chaperone